MATSDEEAPIKRVKATPEIAKTQLDVEACKQMPLELTGNGPIPTEMAGEESAPTVTSAPENSGGVLQNLLKRTKSTPEIAKTRMDVDALHADIATRAGDTAEQAAAFINKVNRVKANAVIARTKLDLDACRDVAISTAEEQVKKYQEIIESQPVVPAKEFKPIDKYQAASPCSSSWEKMSGTGCMRFCEKCQCILYDFSNLELEQAEQIILQREEPGKFVLYKRADGKFLTRDCPVGAAGKRLRLVAYMVLGLLVAGGVAFLLCLPHPQQDVIASKPTSATSGENAPVIPPIVPARPESEKTEPDVAVTNEPHKKTSVSFDRVSYVKRIALLKTQGNDTSKFERALEGIDNDINAGKHRYYIEPQIQELGIKIGLIKPVEVASVKSGAYHSGLTVGFSGQMPAAEAEQKTYFSTKISDDVPLVVKGLFKGGEANPGDFKVGDRILMINGESVNGLTLLQVQEKLSGKEKSELSVSLQNVHGGIDTITLARTLPLLRAAGKGKSESLLR